MKNKADSDAVLLQNNHKHPSNSIYMHFIKTVQMAISAIQMTYKNVAVEEHYCKWFHLFCI